MTARIRVCVGSAAAILILVAGAPTSATAKLRPITGKLTKPGYTVIALAASGEAEAQRAAKGKFSLRPPSKSVTLHLRAPDGTYAGPVVVAGLEGGKRTVVGVRAGADLGKVEVKRGYARLSKRPPAGVVDAKRLANAKKSVPIGAGNFGRVRVKKPKGPTSDRDLDGIAAPLDVDDDGDLVLDQLDSDFAKGGSARTSRVAASQGGQLFPGFIVGAVSSMDLELAQTVNANAPGLTEAQIEAALPLYGTLLMGVQGIFADEGTVVELDCGNPTTGLAYCRKNNSTATKVKLLGSIDSPDPGQGFPSPCCDPDGDGHGSLDRLDSGPAPITTGGKGTKYGVQVLHGATDDQLGTGDVMIARARVGGAETELPGALSYVFNTVPAIRSFTDEAGTATTLTYPVAPGAPGTPGNGFPVADGPDPDSDIEVTLTFWRPQRTAIPGEDGRWTDVGGLAYTIGGPGSRGLQGMSCPASTLSEDDPNLTFLPDPLPAGHTPAPTGRYLDAARDREADAANTLSVTVNLTQCAAAVPQPGSERTISVNGSPPDVLGVVPDTARTRIDFKPQ